MKMKTRVGKIMRGGCRVAMMALIATTVFSAEQVEPVRTLTHVDGRVMLRSPERPRVEFPKAGRTLGDGEILVTGDQSFLEVRAGDEGLWRVGRRAVFIAQASGGRLMAGTALVRVPVETGWQIESARGIVRLGKGVWILQAVDNEGLKVVCLDGPSRVEAWGESSAPLPAPAAQVKLRPGELVFLQPGGKGFGPIVTIYLEELLLTSRLVNGFPEPLKEVKRLRNQGIVQREQLKGVTNALVGGARDAKGFEIVVPKTK